MSTLAAKNAEAVAKRRRAELVAAFEFLVKGASEGPSPDGDPWNRDYDPLPYFEALPDDLRLYDGTGVGALYGLDGSAPHLWQLAGWNIVRRRGWNIVWGRARCAR